MVKFDHQVIEILNEYIPDIYNKSIDISVLELDIDYRNKAQEIMYQINNFKEKADNYRRRRISNDHITDNISSLQNKYTLYMTWGALQVFYKNNINNFDYNILDLHGLYQKEASAIEDPDCIAPSQKEASAILYICIKYLNLKKLNIITGKGKGVIYNITQSILKEFSIKFKLQDNFIITF